MKKAAGFLHKSILFYSIVYISFCFLSRFILNLSGMEYRNWVFPVAYIISVLAIFCGLIQLFLKIKEQWIMNVSVILLLAAFGFVGFFSVIMLMFSWHNEEVVEKDGQKMVAVDYSWLSPLFKHYQYINFFVRGNDELLEYRETVYW